MPNRNKTLEKIFHKESAKSQQFKNEQMIENVRGYIPKKCDLRCYKCRYQGVCIIPRRLMAAWRRYALENKHFLSNRKYGLNNLASMFLHSENYGKILRSLTPKFWRLYRKFSRYRKNSKYER